MNMQDLAGRVQAGHIDALHLVSLEGGIYVLEAQMGDRAYPVEDDLGQPVSLRSVEHARQVLRGLDRVPVELVCADVDDGCVDSWPSRVRLSAGCRCRSARVEHKRLRR